MTRHTKLCHNNKERHSVSSAGGGVPKGRRWTKDFQPATWMKISAA